MTTITLAWEDWRAVIAVLRASSLASKWGACRPARAAA
jgi:hypothetical protein